MKKATRPNVPAKSLRHKAPPKPDRWMTVLSVAEQASWPEIARKSYVISRFWAWFSRIELNPKVKVPVPRFLSYRDP